MIVRTWNLFHGNTKPPGRKAYLREMIELVTADRPTFVCLQEVPAWALESVGTWAGMRGIGDRTRRSLPFGRLITSLHAGFFRSSFNGQGNVILIPPEVTVREHKVITLNTNVFCEEEGRKLGLDAKMMRWWEKERRLCQVLKVEFPNRQRLLIANLHSTSYPGDVRLADAELRRATNFIQRQSEVGEVHVVAGDFNITQAQSQTIATLLAEPPETRWAAAGPLIDHVLVRGAEIATVRGWPDDERRFDGKLLSDHAPVEVDLEVDITPKVTQQS
jgi:endonuclease/exonuclease/phosphatase family metal-dependent hydrolase